MALKTYHKGNNSLLSRFIRRCKFSDYFEVIRIPRLSASEDCADSQG